MIDISSLPTLPQAAADSGEDVPVHFRLDDASPEAETGSAIGPLHRYRYERKMGDSELAYYLPSRQTGVNDMYLHLGFRAPERIVRRSRVCTVWAILRVRHPMLCARVEMNDLGDVGFIYDAPASPEDAYRDADVHLECRTQSKEELIDAHLNGSRTLSNSRLSYLIISEPPSAQAQLPTPPRTPSPTNRIIEDSFTSGGENGTEYRREYKFLLCTTHFVGDGMALHQFGDDFFALLAGGRPDNELECVLREEWHTRWRVPPGTLSQQRLVGGQTFPRQTHSERHSIITTVTFTTERTQTILRNCKAHGVSISAALFAICNLAWARMGVGGDKTAPTLMYSALNLRPYFSPECARPAPWDSYWYLALGYFHVVLPSFLSSDPALLERTFWLRARQAKEQSIRAARSPLAASRTHEMARERADRAREQGVWVASCSSTRHRSDANSPPKTSVLPQRAKVSSAAFIDLSMLGNLDGIYKHAGFPDAELHTLTTGSRQRHGAMLLLAYTFKDRLRIILGYDSNGFEGDVVNRFSPQAGPPSIFQIGLLNVGKLSEG
ncbi:hypothetical protein TRAPUB_4065 [Trametes pubescens]|uniref:Uncharacterized protein n=1 Tax=Trametes pubescens TaxID=154538 RepID=A0A1M2VC14_TRAPU|nr:hypothetical protein TRAPUB_4065 [Trametes pubescens]